MVTSLSETRTSRLVKLLVAKLMFDLFFLIAAVVAYAYIALPPLYRGWTDEADAGHVSGWVADQSNVRRNVDVQLFVDGRFVAGRSADLPRPDVTEKYPAIDQSCGFRFEMPELDPGDHWVSVYAIEATKRGSQPTVQLIGKPVSVKVQ